MRVGGLQFDMGGQGDLIEKVMFGQRAKGMRIASWADIWRKHFLSSGSNKCKDPEVEPARRSD